MRTLSILRHAKSSWDNPGLDDHERPLARRGLRDAARIGGFIRDSALVPDLVLCSDAVRARATLTLVLAEIATAPPRIVLDDALYLAEPSLLVARIASIEPATRHAMVVGHNPGLHALALALSGTGERELLATLAAKLPTAGLAVLDLDIEAWAEIGPGRGRLRAFVTPKGLG